MQRKHWRFQGGCVLALALGMTAVGGLPMAAQGEDQDSAGDLALLQGHRWLLVSEQDAAGRPLAEFYLPGARPIVLRFGDGYLSVEGCNTATGCLSLANGRLGHSAGGQCLTTQTLLGCTYPGDKDEALFGIFRGLPRYRLVPARSPQDLAQLRVESVEGVVLLFEGQPTAQTRYGNAGELIYFDIAPRMVPCASPGKPMRNCLQVRQLFRPEAGSYSPGQSRIADGEAGPWQLLYEPIEGLGVRADEDFEGHGLYIPLMRFRRPSGSDQTAYAYVTVDR